jgi:hypothetical protein
VPVLSGTKAPTAGTVVDPFMSQQDPYYQYNPDKTPGALTTGDPQDPPESNLRKCGIGTLKGLNVAYSIIASLTFVLQAIKRANGDPKLQVEYGSAAFLQNVPLAYLFAEDLLELIRELSDPQTSKVKKFGALPLGVALGFATMLSGFGLAQLSFQKLPSPLTDTTLQSIAIYIYAFYMFSTRAVATTQLSFQIYQGLSTPLYRLSQYCRGDGCCSCSACCESSTYVDYKPAYALLKDLERFGGQISDITEYKDDKAFIEEFYNRLKGENAALIRGVRKKFAPQYTAIETMLGLSKFVMAKGLIFSAVMVSPVWLGVGEKGVDWVAGTAKGGWGWSWLNSTDGALNAAVWVCTLSNIALYLRSAIDFQNSFTNIFTKPRFERPRSSFCGAVNPTAKKLLASFVVIAPLLLTAWWSGSSFSETAKNVEEQYLESGLPCPFGQVANQTIFEQNNFMADQYNAQFRALLTPHSGLLSFPNLLQGLITYIAVAAVNGRGAIRGISRLPGFKDYFNAGVKHNDKSTRHFQSDFQKRVDRGDPSLSAKDQSSEPSILDTINLAREGWKQSSQSNSKCSRIMSFLFSCGDFSYEPAKSPNVNAVTEMDASALLFDDSGTHTKTATEYRKGCCDEDSSCASIVRQFC